MVFGGLIFIGVLAILVGTGSDDLTTSYGGTSKNTTRKLEVGFSEVTPKPKPTSGRAPRATTPNLPPQTTQQEQFTLPPLPSLGPKLERVPSTIPNHFMVCTVNGKGPLLEKLAGRGRLCDLIFLDCTEKNVGEEVKKTFSTNLQSFVNWRTFHDDIDGVLGLSYSMETDAHLYLAVANDLVADIKHMYQYGFRHTAVINIHRENATKEVLDVALYFLRSAFETLSRLESGAIYSVLGAAINTSMLQVLLDEMKRVFVPSMFIFITHVSHQDKASKDCRIVPPTWLSVPNGEVSYGQSLVLCKPNIRFFDKVQRSEHFMFTFNTSAQRALTFEIDATIKSKVCEAKSTCQGVTFVVAAYDIEYDDQPDYPPCPEFGLVAPFGRVAFLKKMNTYLTHLSSEAAFNKEECLRVELR
ncbi:uncharacterized protein LOC144142082 isoform X2 [Haemaphysalis longicornis]